MGATGCGPGRAQLGCHHPPTRRPTPPDDPAIYHITHLANLPGIVAADGLWSDAQRIRRQLAVTNIGHLHIKQRRLSRVVPLAAGGSLGDYVPFNFCPRSVMLFVVHRGHDDYASGQDDILHLVSSARTAIATRRPWAFTDRHAELGYAEYFDDLIHLGEIDWSTMDRRFWKECSEARQAEFLVHDFFPWTAVREVVARSEKVADAARAFLRGAAHVPPVDVKPAWYY